MPLRPAVFLDRDGTLNAECGYVTRPDQLQLLPGVADALRRLGASGFVCVVVTNQSGVARGYLTEAELDAIHAELERQLAAQGATLDRIYCCVAGPDSEHPERKPAPGMLLRAARELELDLTRSWMVGDSLRDIQAGRQAGCRGCILVRSGHDVADVAALLQDSDQLVDDLTAAVSLILRTAGNDAV
jgi:D-glycero-D-manno-heptose 1,7-bisphosphate phosphatase